MSHRYEYPVECSSPRARRQYRAGYWWGAKDGAKGKTWAVCGPLWIVVGYQAGNEAARGAVCEAQPFENMKGGAHVA
jgi:hypothetical protein